MNMDQLLETARNAVESAGRSGVFVIASLAVVWIAKLIFDQISRCDDDAEIEKQKNLAMGIRRCGLYLGLVIGMIGAIVGPSSVDFGRDLGMFCLEGFVLVLMMLVASMVANKVLLASVNNDEEIVKGNLAVGWLEFGTYVAVGLIAFASFFGEGGGFASAAVFFALGLVGLIVVFQLYKVGAKFNLSQEIGSGNVAAGLYIGARLIALGIILAASLVGQFTDWAQDITSFVLFFVLGAVFLSIVSWLADALFLPKTRIREQILVEKNVASVAVVAGLQIGAAVIIAAAI